MTWTIAKYLSDHREMDGINEDLIKDLIRSLDSCEDIVTVNKNELVSLLMDCEALVKESLALSAMSTDTFLQVLKNTMFDPASREFYFSHPAFSYIVLATTKFFEDAKGKNYIEIKLRSKKLGWLSWVIQRVDKKTPSELRADAERALAETKRALDEANKKVARLEANIALLKAAKK